MSDRELLELAARAAGMGPVLCYESARNCLRVGDRTSYALWRPLTDDGDALRMAVKLRMDIYTYVNGARVEVTTASGPVIESKHSLDALAATRRAIVRAAAEIGRAATPPASKGTP